jgi:hypothetical protein
VGIVNDGTTYVDAAFQGGWDVTRGALRFRLASK